MYLSLYCKGSKRLFKVCVREGAGDRTELQYIDPHSYGHQRCVFLVLLMLNRMPGGLAFCWVLAFSTTSCHQWVSETTGGPEGPFGREWLSLPHLISNFSGPQLIRGSKIPFGLAWLSLPHLVSITPTLTSVLTELYNSSTPTQSPTQSLEWHVWSSSSGNNCHAVHRSLSSGASLWSVTFTLSHIISRAHLRDFFRLLAIEMCPFRYLWNGMFARAEGQNTTILRHHHNHHHHRVNSTKFLSTIALRDSLDRVQCLYRANVCTWDIQ